MIDLSYKKPETKIEDDNEIIHPFVAIIAMVIFSAFMAIVVLSAIAGEPIF